MPSVQRATGKWAGVTLACILAFNLHAQTRDPILDRISSAAKDTSQLADTLFQLTVSRSVRGWHFDRVDHKHFVGPRPTVHP